MEKHFLDSKATAKYLSISIHQLYKLNRSGQLQSYAPTGGKIYFKADELDEWIEAGKKLSTSNVNKKIGNYLIKK